MSMYSKSTIALVMSLASFLILKSGTSKAEENLEPEVIDAALCDYSHILEQKKINDSDVEKRNEFGAYFTKCVPIYEQWATEAVAQMNPEQKQLFLNFYERMSVDEVEHENSLAILLKQVFGEPKCMELMCDGQDFYKDIFLVFLDRLCHGFDGTLSELSRIYDLLISPPRDGESLDEIVGKLKVFRQNAGPLTFEWVIYARSCASLKENRKLLSEEVRRLFLSERPKPPSHWALRIFNLKPKFPENCENPDEYDFEGLED